MAHAAPRPADTGVPACLDMEASGFGRDSYPIEVGFVLGDGRSWCTLVRPAEGWTHWDPAAERLHGISRELAQRHGRDVAAVADQLNRQLQGQTLYCDGWAHDYAWLNRLFDAAEAVPAFRLDSLRSRLDEAEAERWHVVKQQVAGEWPAARHRASTDAKLLQMTWQRLREATATRAGAVPR
jgi:hypothetical protein